MAVIRVEFESGGVTEVAIITVDDEANPYFYQQTSEFNSFQDHRRSQLVSALTGLGYQKIGQIMEIGFS